MSAVTLRIETEQEADGRWLADVVDLPGAMAYGTTREEALTKVEAVALRVLADRVEHREMKRPDKVEFSFAE